MQETSTRRLLRENRAEALSGDEVARIVEANRWRRGRGPAKGTEELAEGE